MKIHAIILIAVVLAVVGAAPALADHPGHNLIVPGERIGPAKLGMTRAQIAEVNKPSGCPVTAVFDKSGKAIWLMTTWAPICETAGGSGAGGQDFAIALREFAARPPELSKVSDYLTANGVKERDYLDAKGNVNTTAFWVSFPVGIAFRVLWSYEFKAAMVQAVAVFPVGSNPKLPPDD